MIFLKIIAFTYLLVWTVLSCILVKSNFGSQSFFHAVVCGRVKETLRCEIQHVRLKSNETKRWAAFSIIELIIDRRVFFEKSFRVWHLKRVRVFYRQKEVSPFVHFILCIRGCTFSHGLCLMIAHRCVITYHPFLVSCLQSGLPEIFIVYKSCELLEIHLNYWIPSIQNYLK